MLVYCITCFHMLIYCSFFFKLIHKCQNHSQGRLAQIYRGMLTRTNIQAMYLVKNGFSAQGVKCRLMSEALMQTFYICQNCNFGDSDA